MSGLKAALKASKAALDAQDFDGAVAQSHNAISIDSGSYFAHVFLGRALEKQSKAHPAIDAYKKAASLKPDDELAWKGLCNVSESLGSQGVEVHTNSSLQLAKIYADKDEKEQCQTVIDKSIAFAKEHGTRKLYKEALQILLPTSPIYEYLEGRIQPASITFTRLAELTEVEERERINKEIGERRTRLGARLGQVTTEVTMEVFSKSDIEYLYQQVINWTNDDELRREYEEKLFHRAYDHLVALPAEEKGEKLAQVLKMASDLVIIKHPFKMAWQLNLEWKDVDDLGKLDVGILREFVVFFPDSGLAKVVQGHLGEDLRPERAVQVNVPSEDGEPQESSVPEPLNAEDRLIMLTDGLEESKSSAFAHRIVSDYYRQIEEYESCVDISRQGLLLVREESTKSGLRFENNRDAFNTNLATSLVYYQAPKNHPEAQNIFNGILKRSPTSTAALLGLGLILEEQEDYEKASTSLESALSKDPGNARIGTEAAWCKALTGNLTTGLEALESFLPSLDATKAYELKGLTLYRIGKCLWDLKTDRANRKDRKGAYSRFIGALKANPNLAPAYTSLGVYYADYGKDRKRARQCFQQAFELSGTETLAAERLARAFADDSDWDIVEIISQRVIGSGVAKPSPGSKRRGLSWPFSALGIVQMNKQEYQNAVVSFQAALRISPADYNAWVGLGESYNSSGRYIAAQRTLEHARTIAQLDQGDDLRGGLFADHVLANVHREVGDESNGQWFADYMLANVHRELGDYEEALNGYEWVLDKRPFEYGVWIALLQTWVERAWHSLETGFFGLASDCAKFALEAAANMMSDTSYGGVAKFNVWRAVGDALSTFALLPDNIGRIPLNNLSTLLLQIFPEGEQELESADQITRDKLIAAIGAASSTEVPHMLDLVISGAILAYKRAISASAHDLHAQAIAWYNLGWMEFTASRCLSQSDKTSLKPPRLIRASVRCFKRAIELEAGNADFWNALGVVTTGLSPKVAQHSFVRSLHLNERSARAWSNLGALYLIQGDEGLAHEAFARAQSTDPDYAHAWIGEGLIAANLGDQKEALSHFKHAAEISDSSSTLVNSRASISSFDFILSGKGGSTELATLEQLILSLQQLRIAVPLTSSYKHLLSLVHERVGDFAPSTEALTAICSEMEKRFEETEDPEYLARFATTKADLARACLAGADYSSAVEHAETALDLTAEEESGGLDASQRQKLRLSAHLTAGISQYYFGSLDQSIDMFREALLESRNSAEVTCLVAQVLWATGREEEKNVARDQLFESIEAHPGHAQATSLIGAMSVIDGDSETLEAVMEDLQSQRTDAKLGRDERKRLENLMGAFANLTSEDDEDILSEARTSVMLSPGEPEAWSRLAAACCNDGEGQTNVADMAARTAMQASPPNGDLDASTLAEALAATDTVGNAQRAAMVCPWHAAGWESLASMCA